MIIAGEKFNKWYKEAFKRGYQRGYKTGRENCDAHMNSLILVKDLEKKQERERTIAEMIDESYMLSGECNTASEHHLKLIDFLKELKKGKE